MCKTAKYTRNLSTGIQSSEIAFESTQVSDAEFEFSACHFSSSYTVVLQFYIAINYCRKLWLQTYMLEETVRRFRGRRLSVFCGCWKAFILYNPLSRLVNVRKLVCCAFVLFFCWLAGAIIRKDVYKMCIHVYIFTNLLKEWSQGQELHKTKNWICSQGFEKH